MHGHGHPKIQRIMQIIHCDPEISHFVLVGACALQCGQLIVTESVCPKTLGGGADGCCWMIIPGCCTTIGAGCMYTGWAYDILFKEIKFKLKYSWLIKIIQTNNIDLYSFILVLKLNFLFKYITISVHLFILITSSL